MLLREVFFSGTVNLQLNLALQDGSSQHGSARRASVDSLRDIKLTKKIEKSETL